MKSGTMPVRDSPERIDMPIVYVEKCRGRELSTQVLATLPLMDGDIELINTLVYCSLINQNTYCCRYQCDHRRRDLMPYHSVIATILGEEIYKPMNIGVSPAYKEHIPDHCDNLVIPVGP